MSFALPADLLQHLRESVRCALIEDVGPGDLTAALVPSQQHAHARVISRQRAVICGQAWFEEVFRRLEPAITVRWRIAEGAGVDPDTVLCEVDGPARPVLTGERVALNFLQTLSGTATLARRYTEAVAGTRARILDTRKTIPGLRLAQKYAVRAGGGHNHRIGLYDAILIKENHIVAAGSITAAVDAARRQSAGVMVEVEVESPAELNEALTVGADRLLLDNFPVADLRAAVAARDQIAPAILLEASGGITLDNIRAAAETGVDFISIGDLTKNLHAVDLSMRFRWT
jgi:nicotinate-nucleotide pyrophosphorylase (carboxylating)